jgi:hypothetical protein
MISPSTTTLPANNRSRVKLYTLNEERQWDDRGTGFVTCASPIAPNTNHAIIVKSEVDGSTLLDSKIHLILFVIFISGNINRLVRRRKI